ncbi:hypothetical protein CR983_02870 [Candidatus Saccharibacteria bacterium]|nr:MAG: hypothetical protein CR983_02870 [Candidatus Saccharibacteria bacterium]
MATYKVAQDVEAEDKLIGPFGFRQFIYLIVVAMACAMAWGLSQIFIPLAIIPLPIIIFFGALALPLRKDQPMETYLAAIVSFYLKPHKRLWKPDGIESLIEITTPKEVEEHLTKEISSSETERRLTYLTAIADTRGWSVRNVAPPSSGGTSMHLEIYNEAQRTTDVLDDGGAVAQSFDTMLQRASSARREQAIEYMHKPEGAAPAPLDPASVQYNPYPTNIHQTVITPIHDEYGQPTASPAPQQPTAAQPAQPAAVPTSDANTPSSEPVSADIMNLANNTTLSVETIAHEAKRIEQKNDEEVVISLH